MKKTEHLKLSQWDLTDPIKMDDFNRDNAILDALGRRGRSELIKTHYHDPSDSTSWTGSNARNLLIPVSDLDWSEWELIYFFHLGPLTDAGAFNYMVRPYDSSTTWCSTSVDFIARCSPIGPHMVVLLPRHDPKALVQTFYTGVTSGAGRAGIAYENVTDIELLVDKNTDYLNSPRTVELWGVR